MLTIEQFLQDRDQLNEKQKVLMGVVYSANQIIRNLESILRPYHLSASQYNVMLILKRYQPETLSVQQISNRVLERSDVPRLIQRLESTGLVKTHRRIKGQRTKNVSLTEKGLAKLKLIAQAKSEIEKPSSMLSYEEAKQFNLLLQKILLPIAPREELIQNKFQELTGNSNSLNIPKIEEVLTQISNVDNTTDLKSNEDKHGLLIVKREQHRKAS